MPFAMTRSAFNEWVVVSNARFLRCFGNTVHIRTDSDDRFAISPTSDPSSGDTCNIFFNRKAFFFKNIGQVFRRFPFLKTEFSEAENHIVHFRRLVVTFFNFGHDFLFQGFQFFRRETGLGVTLLAKRQ